MEWDSIPIEQLNLSARVVKCLRSAGYNYVSQILELSIDDIESLQNIGSKSAQELVTVISHIKSGKIYLSKGVFGETIINRAEDIDADDGERTVLQIAFPDLKTNDVVQIKYMDQNGLYCDDLHILNCGFSPRTENALRRCGYEYISEIVALNENDINNINSFGKKSKDELYDFLETKVKLLFSRNSVTDEADLFVTALKNKYGTCEGFFDSVNIRAALSQISSVLSNADIKNNPEDYIEKVEFEKSFLSNENVKDEVIQFIKSKFNSVEWSDIRSLKIILPSIITGSELFKQVINELCEDDYFEIQDNMIRLKYMGIDDWLNSLQDNDREAVTYRLEGLTLEAAGNRMGVTGDCVRQLVEGALDNKPRLREDAYAYWIDNYEINQEAFIYIFGVSDRIYRYLTLGEVAGNKDIEEILSDPAATKDIYLRTKEYLVKESILIGETYVPKYRNLICRQLAKMYCSEHEMSYSEFYKIYNRTLEDNNLTDDERLSYPSERAFEVRLSDSFYVLNRYGRKFRYYDIKKQDISNLIWSLHLDQFKNVEIGAFKLFEDNKYLMEEYGIIDGYELHNLLKKTENIWNAEGTYQVDFGRTPFIVFGDASREKQVRNLLYQVAPVSAEEFDKLYEDEYGVLSTTVAANFHKYIDEFYHNGMFETDQPLLNEKEVSFMLGYLSEDFYFTEDVQNRFSDEFGEHRKDCINARTLKQLGYDVYSNYILKNSYSSAREYFESALTSRDLIDLDAMDSRLYYVQMFNTTLNMLRQSLDLIEYEDRQFIKFTRIQKIYPDITKERLHRYADELISAIDDVFFTVESAEHKGFDLMSSKLGVSKWFDASLVRTSDKVRFVRSGGTFIFYKGNTPFTTVDFIHRLLEKNEMLDYYELDSILRDEYGINIERNNLIYLIKGSDMYYDDILDRIYLSKELYYEDI